jgi:pimeloyl-ACP methyl ester carboxylesterase
VFSRFTPSRRGGSGPPLVCLHGFLDTWRTWQLVLPALERSHDVLAVTLPGHAGGPPVPRPLTLPSVVDAVEGALDAAGLASAHMVGNSLGGFLALQLAARGRAESVVAFAPAGGWAEDDRSREELLAYQRVMQERVRASRPTRTHSSRRLRAAVGRRSCSRRASSTSRRSSSRTSCSALRCARRPRS